MRSVRVEWEGPFCLDYVIDELNGKDDYGIPDLWNSYRLRGKFSALHWKGGRFDLQPTI